MELFTDLEWSILDILRCVSPCIYRSRVLCNKVCDIFYSLLAYTTRLFCLNYFCRSVSGETLTGSVEVLKKFPQEQRSALVVAFYVILKNIQGESYAMNQNALIDALKESVPALSSSIKKEVYNIHPYLKDYRISPPSRESQIDELQNKWIIIGVSATIAFVMVMVLIALYR